MYALSTLKKVPVRGRGKSATNGARDANIGVTCVTKTKDDRTTVVVKCVTSRVGSKRDMKMIITSGCSRETSLLVTSTLILVDNAAYRRSKFCCR